MKNIKIESVYVKSVFHGSLDGSYDGVFHQKILSTLSVVQALEGSYEVSIDGSKVFSTGEGGVFIAPKSTVQKIMHRNGQNGKMTAQWVFIDAFLNDGLSFDEIFSLPVILDKKYNQRIERLIKGIRFESDCFEKTKHAISILKILYENASFSKKRNSIKDKIEKFVDQNYRENITATDIAKALYCSPSQVFKHTNKFFNLSPANYINGIRLAKAEKLLAFSDDDVTKIALSVGFYDVCYFSKLFKKRYGLSPLNYRKDFIVKNSIK